MRWFLIFLLLVPSVAGAQDSVGFWSSNSLTGCQGNQLGGLYTAWPWTGKIKHIRASIYSNCTASCPKGRAGIYLVDSLISGSVYITAIDTTDEITIVNCTSVPCYNTFTFPDSVSVTEGNRYFLCVNFQDVALKTEYMVVAAADSVVADTSLIESGHTYFSMPAEEIITPPLTNDFVIYAVGKAEPPPSTGQVIIIQ